MYNTEFEKNLQFKKKILSALLTSQPRKGASTRGNSSESLSSSSRAYPPNTHLDSQKTANGEELGHSGLSLPITAFSTFLVLF